MHLARRHPKALPRLPRDPGKQRRGVVRIEPVQGASQAVVMQELGGDPWAQQVLDRLGGKELRDQIQPAIAEAQPIQDHRHGRRSHTHLLLARSGHRIQIRRQPNLLAHPGHDPQMIQPFDSVFPARSA